MLTDYFKPIKKDETDPVQTGEDTEDIHMGTEWRDVLKCELSKDYFKSLKIFVDEEMRKHTVFPPSDKIYYWSLVTPFRHVKVVILGQDPYHNYKQATGLAFSVPPGMSLPPSLVNIFKELERDVGIRNTNGCLDRWAQQGVLLLNTSLTVRVHEPASHSNCGWEKFTDAIMDTLNKKKNNLVFILWGAHAQKKCTKIDRKKHFVISSAHPSPLSATRGFFGSSVFSKTNLYLREKGIKEIDWNT